MNDIETQLFRASRITLPDDPLAWLLKAEEDAKSLPETYGGKAMIFKYVGYAQDLIKESGDDAQLRLAFVKIKDYFDRALLLQLHSKYAAVKKGGASGGVKGGGQNRKVDPEQIKKAREKLLCQGRSTREIASILGARYGVSARTIRNALAKQ